MAKFEPWLKMWVEWIDDPKMLSLSMAEQCAWWRLVTLAKRCMADGLLVKGNGAPLSLKEIAGALRTTAKADRKVLDSMIEKMINMGGLHWDQDTLIVTHFAERQAKTTSETPEAIRERVRRYRERRAASLPPTNPPLKIKKDIETVTEAESLSLHAVTCNGNPVTSEAALAEMAILHEENFSLITPILSEKLKDFAENYRGPLGWIHDAFAEACSQNVRKWAYVEKILETWQAEGRKSHGKEKQQGKDTRPGAYRQGTREHTAKELRDSLNR